MRPHRLIAALAATAIGFPQRQSMLSKARVACQGVQCGGDRARQRRRGTAGRAL